MKECRIPFKIFEQYRTSAISYNKKQLNTFFMSKLKKAGFDLSRRVIRFKNRDTRELVIQQLEEGDRGYNGT